MTSFMYEWRKLDIPSSLTPSARVQGTSWHYKKNFWLLGGQGAGSGRTMEVWRMPLVNTPSDSSSIVDTFPLPLYDNDELLSWKKIEPTTPDEPSPRDGHSSNYIGNGVVIVFGGQSYSSSNPKVGKEGEMITTRSFTKRDVLNDIWIFDCEKKQWQYDIINGLTVPLGRRAHCAVYIKDYETNSVVNERIKLYNDAIAATDQAQNKNNSHSLLSENSSIVGSITGSTSSISSASYLDSNSLSSLATEKKSSNSHMNSTECKVNDEDEEIDYNNSLIVYGGAGIELSKHAEQIYNDLWVYNLESKKWRRIITNGMEPIAVSDAKMTQIGDNLLIIGGISSTKKTAVTIEKDTGIFTLKPNQNKFVPSESFSLSLNTDIQVFNLRTKVWNLVQFYDGLGRPFRLNLHGFVLLPETLSLEKATKHCPKPENKKVNPYKQKNIKKQEKNFLIETSYGSKPFPTKFFIFGGNEVIDNRIAAMSKKSKSPGRGGSSSSKLSRNNSLNNSSFFEEEEFYQENLSIYTLDLNDLSIRTLSTTNPSRVTAPSQRFSPFYIPPYSIEFYERKEEMRQQEQKTYETYLKKLKNNTKKVKNPFRSNKNPLEPLIEVPLGYFFGGSSKVTSGYCDPYIYALYQVPVDSNGKPINKSFIRSSTLLTNSTDCTSKESYHPNNNNSNNNNNGFFPFDSFDNLNEFFNRQPSSSSLSLFDADISDQPSIWENFQNRANLSKDPSVRLDSLTIQDPKNWEELKLSLTHSFSQKSVDFSRFGGQNSIDKFSTSIDSTQEAKEKDLISMLKKESRKKYQKEPLHDLISTPEFSVRSVSTVAKAPKKSPFRYPLPDLPREVLNMANSNDFIRSQSLATFTQLSPNSSTIHNSSNLSPSHSISTLSFCPSASLIQSNESFPVDNNHQQSQLQLNASANSSFIAGKVSKEIISSMIPKRKENVPVQDYNKKKITKNSTQLNEEKKKKLAEIERFNSIKQNLKPIIEKKTKIEAWEQYDLLYPSPDI